MLGIENSVQSYNSILKFLNLIFHNQNIFCQYVQNASIVDFYSLFLDVSQIFFSAIYFI